jgi:hypothetical protein
LSVINLFCDCCAKSSVRVTVGSGWLTYVNANAFAAITGSSLGFTYLINFVYLID